MVSSRRDQECGVDVWDENVWEKSLPSRGKASAKALRQGQGGGLSGWREGEWVVRRQQVPRGFVSSAKDPTWMRWETTGEHWVEEWNLLSDFKSIPLAAVWRTGCRESRVEARRPVPERFHYSSLHSRKHILRADIHSRYLWTYIQHRNRVFKCPFLSDL